MNFEFKVIVIFILGFIYINIATLKENNEINIRKVMIRNIGITTLMFSIIIDKSLLCLLSMLTLIFLYFINESRSDLKAIFLELILLIILTPLVNTIPDLAYPEFARPFTRELALNLGILISIMVLFLNIYYLLKIKIKTYALILFIVLNAILYLEYIYLIFNFIK